MLNSNNNKWFSENPLLKGNDQKYYYDFGTGNKIEREDVKKQREAFLKGTSKTSSEPKKQEKDNFLEGFDDPYGEKRGYEVSTYEGDTKIYNLNIPDADTYIMSFWNSDKITEKVHTVSMDKLPNGKYRIYNEGSETAKDIESLNEYFREESRVPLVLHCIKKGK